VAGMPTWRQAFLDLWERARELAEAGTMSHA
jgi:hypothetical protein